jgi:hypothetical protein
MDGDAMEGQGVAEMRPFMIRIGIWVGRGLGTMRTGMRRLGRTRTRTGRPGTGDDKENEIVLENVQDIA